jgi:hypothetical protein
MAPRRSGQVKYASQIYASQVYVRQVWTTQQIKGRPAEERPLKVYVRVRDAVKRQPI